MAKVNHGLLHDAAGKLGGTDVPDLGHCDAMGVAALD
jgi:hypothetical protein